MRAWEEKGAFLSVPLTENLDKVVAILRSKLPHCRVKIADHASFSAHILPREHKEANLTEVFAQIQKNELRTDDLTSDANIVSDVGTMIGVFEPRKGAMILIMYPMKIAAAIARGKGVPTQNTWSEIGASFPAELDLEYNFGDVAVNILGGTGKLSMRQGTDLVFRHLRKSGYVPGPTSEQQMKRLDGFFIPDRHETFWQRQDGVIRVEFEKLNHGRLRMNLHETRQLRS